MCIASTHADTIGLVTSPIPSFIIFLSGFCFESDSEKVSFIQKYYPEALACEMEGCAIAQVCDSYHYPFIVIRSFSDIVIKKGNELDFDKYKELASKRAADFLFKLCQID